MMATSLRTCLAPERLLAIGWTRLIASFLPVSWSKPAATTPNDPCPKRPSTSYRPPTSNSTPPTSYDTMSLMTGVNYMYRGVAPLLYNSLAEAAHTRRRAYLQTSSIPNSTSAVVFHSTHCPQPTRTSGKLHRDYCCCPNLAPTTFKILQTVVSVRGSVRTK